MPKYRKKPIVIEAVQWTGHNREEVVAFIGDNGFIKGDYVYIRTLEGLMAASANDYIIKGIQGEFYPCKHNIFEQTYEKAPE